MSNTSNNKKAKVNSTLAKSDDGTIQINYSISFSEIKNARTFALADLAKEVEVPGFRKGKAPLDKVQQKIPQTTLIEKTLSKILPKIFSDSIAEHKITPAIYPKFELIKADENDDWQVRAITCEMPEINLGDYKKIVAGEARSKNIWTPGKGDAKKPKELTREQKEQSVITSLLNNIKLYIPKIMIDQEVDARLARLLERIEKLGLTLDSYLASVNKDAQTLRNDYENQAKQSLTLELILAKIADSESVVINDTQIESTLKAAATDPKMAGDIDTPQQRRVIESILRRRAALDALISFI